MKRRRELIILLITLFSIVTLFLLLYENDRKPDVREPQNKVSLEKIYLKDRTVDELNGYLYVNQIFSQSVNVEFDESLFANSIEETKSYSMSAQGVEILSLPETDQPFFIVQKNTCTNKVNSLIENSELVDNNNLFYFDSDNNYQISREYDFYPIGPSSNVEYQERLSNTYRNDIFSFNLIANLPVINYPNVSYIFSDKNQEESCIVNRIREAMFSTEYDLDEIEINNKKREVGDLLNSIRNGQILIIPSLNVYSWKELFMQRYDESSLSAAKISATNFKESYFLIKADDTFVFVPTLLFKLVIHSDADSNLNGETIEAFIPLYDIID